MKAGKNYYLDNHEVGILRNQTRADLKKRSPADIYKGLSTDGRITSEQLIHHARALTKDDLQALERSCVKSETEVSWLLAQDERYEGDSKISITKSQIGLVREVIKAKHQMEEIDKLPSFAMPGTPHKPSRSMSP